MTATGLVGLILPAHPGSRLVIEMCVGSYLGIHYNRRENTLTFSIKKNAGGGGSLHVTYKVGFLIRDLFFTLHL